MPDTNRGLPSLSSLRSKSSVKKYEVYSISAAHTANPAIQPKKKQLLFMFCS
jgi:hypothetical protein